jgi:transcriptional regulator with XRE-family HTH domain
MGAHPPRNYTTLGRRISALCGTQDAIAVALGLNRSQVSRKLRGKMTLSSEDIYNIANHFSVPIWLFFVEPDMDGAVLQELYRMFMYDPVALDWIIEAFKKKHSNLKQLGEIGKQLCKENHDAVRSS